MFWNLAVVRGVYGAIGCIFSIYERYFDEDLWVDLARSRTVISQFITLTHMGFFLFEWPALIFFDIRFRTFSKGLHCHHIVALIGYFTTFFGNQSHYFAVSAFILEMSTPFSCICYCLIKTGMSKSLIWRINQMVMIHTFHLRSVVECGMMYDLIKHWDKFSQLSTLWIINATLGLFTIGLILTPYWTYRKTEQLFTGSDWNTGEQKKNENNGGSSGHQKKKE